MAQRLEPQVWTAQVMPAPPEQIGEQPSMPVEVEQLGLRARVLEPLGAQYIAKGTLACTRRPQHQKMPDVAHMVHHPEERRLIRMGIEPGPAPQVGVTVRARPRRREAGAEMRQGQRML